MTDNFTINVADVADDVGHAVDVVVTGEIDILTAPRLRAVLDNAASLSDRVMLDLAGVEFIDSTGLSALVAADATMTDSGKSLQLKEPSVAVQRLLQLAGLRDHFTAADPLPTQSPSAVDDPVGRQLTQVIVELASALLTEHSLRDDLEGVIRFACQVVPGCSAASVALVIDGAPTTVAVSEHIALELDIVQYETADGPCLVALDGGQIRVDVLDADDRFQHFAAGAADHQVNSVLSMPIIHDADVVGTLNFYGRDTNVFDDTAEGIARLASTQAAEALARCEAITAAHERRDQLQALYDEQTLRPRAQGVLIASQRCSTEQARHLIDNAADQRDTPLTIAHRILAAAQRDSSR